MKFTQFLCFEIGNTCNLAKDHAGKCPISLDDRYGTMDTSSPMPDKLIVDCCKIAYEELGFTGLIGWHYYCEPLCNAGRMLNLMKQIREAVPKARFVLWTNGTLIDDAKKLEQFEQIYITDYERKDWGWLRDALPNTRIARFSADMDDRIDPPRGHDETRCLRPFNELVFDYYGNAHLCCIDFRGKHWLGNIQQESMKEITSRFLAARNLVSLRTMPSESPEICFGCHNRQPLLWPVETEIGKLIAERVANYSPLKIAMCFIATERYNGFLDRCLRTARTHFFSGKHVHYHIFSDRKISGPDLTYWPMDHLKWPYITLFRYHSMLRAKAELLQYDYVYYLDVDSWFVADVGEEILSELVGTIHPGFCGAPRSNLPYCKNINSTAYIYPYEGKRHYCGAFQGGRADRYIEAMEAMKAAIDTDNRYGIIADWHDESQWNRYLASNPPTLSLSHDYCSPINWGIKSAKIVNPVTGPFCGCTGGRG